jgi:hypothetical protein
MRLLNLNSLDLVEFMDLKKPPYVILSHTWGAEEISLQELQSQHPDVKRKNGWTKILNFARKGNENGFEWGWVDTCCIDKTSSAELSEAINSMFKVSHTSIPICSSLYENYGPRVVIFIIPLIWSYELRNLNFQLSSTEILGLICWVVVSRS